eukprot:CAMPEP_0168322114 /NCGR_PEP_ID=MMETSP0213-20121227/2686_1 /TAXON_ID=151035 /ORGANISM="Euplotes harpa, Strain FSP1.4" /LENGTH=54 /DNA_ID=CAMNT_0008323919 /DNA_START=198 /DNA_END=362 /DNA_ORIENTATION=+
MKLFNFSFGDRAEPIIFKRADHRVGLQVLTEFLRRERADASSKLLVFADEPGYK